jgi:hypothetical protein
LTYIDHSLLSRTRWVYQYYPQLLVS